MLKWVKVPIYNHKQCLSYNQETMGKSCLNISQIATTKFSPNQLIRNVNKLTANTTEH